MKCILSIAECSVKKVSLVFCAAFHRSYDYIEEKIPERRVFWVLTLFFFKELSLDNAF